MFLIPVSVISQQFVFCVLHILLHSYWHIQFMRWEGLVPSQLQFWILTKTIIYKNHTHTHTHANSITFQSKVRISVVSILLLHLWYLCVAGVHSVCKSIFFPPAKIMYTVLRRINCTMDFQLINKSEF